MASVAMIIIMRTDVLGFRTIELPPNDSATHLDLWWHLSLIQQLMGSAPFQVPQVVGEGLEYHYFSHVHMAIGANTAHIDPELILFRLWVIPVILVTIGISIGALGFSFT